METTESQRPLGKTRLNDSGKLLVVLDAAAQPPALEMREDRLDSYLYLLNRETVLPLGYAFTFEPLPFSSQLWSDIAVFRGLDFVASASPSLTITDDGKTWVRERLERAKDAQETVTSIREHLSRYVNWDTATLSRYIYYEATQL